MAFTPYLIIFNCNFIRFPVLHCFLIIVELLDITLRVSGAQFEKYKSCMLKTEEKFPHKTEL